MMSASPRDITRNASPTAWAPDEQAVQGAEFGPSSAKANRHLPGRKIDDAGRNEERRDLPRAAFQQRSMFPLDHRESANTGPDEHPGALGSFRSDDQAGLASSQKSAAATA
jgi:hypothetical protein